MTGAPHAPLMLLSKTTTQAEKVGCPLSCKSSTIISSPLDNVRRNIRSRTSEPDGPRK